MRNYVAIIVASERAAFAARDALEQLAAEGAITIHDAAVIERHVDGPVVPRWSRTNEPALRRPGIGALLGALAGLSVGPIGAAIGGTVGVLGGALDDAVHHGASDEYVQRIGEHLAPATFALIADVHATDPGVIDSRMAALGATVLRETRRAPVEDLFDKRDEARRAALSK